MRISQSKSNKKPIIIASVVILLILLFISAFYWYVSSKTQANNPHKTQSSTTQETDNSDKNTTKTNNDTTDTTENSKTDDPSSMNSDNDNFVDTPISNPPTDNSPYPIKNEHYKIEQLSQNHYSITLYPIVNHPDQQTEYDAALKQYKQEVLTYLKNRYGDTSTFTFDWNPDHAKDV